MLPFVFSLASTNACLVQVTWWQTRGRPPFSTSCCPESRRASRAPFACPPPPPPGRNRAGMRRTPPLFLPWHRQQGSWTSCPHSWGTRRRTCWPRTCRRPSSSSGSWRSTSISSPRRQRQWKSAGVFVYISYGVCFYSLLGQCSVWFQTNSLLPN